MRDRIRAWWRARSGTFRVLSSAAALGLSLAVAGNLVFYVASRSPRACLACHFMRPYYDQWTTSSHRKIGCLACHPFRPLVNTANVLKYWTGTYQARPLAEVDDASCLKSACHAGVPEGGRVMFKGTIAFDHRGHVGQVRRGERLRCTSCHSQIVQGRHLAVTEKVCFLCHFKGAAPGTSATGCPSCHGTPTRVVEHQGFSFSHESYLKAGVACNQCHMEVAQGTGQVPKERCHSCHVERLEKYPESLFLHRVHVTGRGIDCFRCHEEIRHGEVQMVQTLEIRCESCHRRLHSPQKQMYMGAGGQGVRDTPSRMFLAQVSCDGCHTRAVEGRVRVERTLEPERRACVACHGKGYDRMLDDWRREIALGIRFVEPILRSAEATVRGARGKRAGVARELVADARFNVTLVRDGHGAHNPDYAVQLLRASLDQVELAYKGIDGAAPLPPRPALLGAPDGTCLPLCHARLGVPEKVYFREMRLEFPHRLHHDGIGLACTTCHSPEKHKMRVLSKEGCMECHHKPEERPRCERCHPQAVALYRGANGGPRVGPSPMAQAGIGCEGCHDLTEQDQSVAALKGRCVGCHAEGYDAMLVEWENDLNGREAKLTLETAQVEDLLRLRPPSKGAERARALLKRASMAVDRVSTGRGVHHYAWAQELLSEAETDLDASLKLLR